MKIRNIEWTTSVKLKDPKNTPLYTSPVAKMTSACMASEGWRSIPVPNRTKFLLETLEKNLETKISVE